MLRNNEKPAAAGMGSWPSLRGWLRVSQPHTAADGHRGLVAEPAQDAIEKSGHVLIGVLRRLLRWLGYITRPAWKPSQIAFKMLRGRVQSPTR